jgi:hypothetical protein
MHSAKRQTPLIMVNVANLAVFVIGVAVIFHMDQVDEQCEAYVPARSDAKAQTPMLKLRSERESVTLDLEPLSEKAHSTINVAEFVEENPILAAFACEAPAALSTQSLIRLDREDVADPSEDCDDNSMVRCEAEAIWTQVREEHEAWARVCESAEQGERSIWVPVLFAMFAGAVMNVSLVTSLPGLL